MTVNEAGKLGADRRHQTAREPIRSKARQMREQLQLPPDPRLAPPLMLFGADRLI